MALLRQPIFGWCTDMPLIPYPTIGIGMGVGVAGVGGGGGIIEAPSEVIGGLPHFEGDNLGLNTPVTGIVDTKLAVISFWFNLTGGDSTTRWIMALGVVSPNENRFTLTRHSSNRLEMVFRDSANDIVWSARSFDQKFSTTINPGWHHFLAAMNAGTGVRHIYVDDILEPLETDELSNKTVDYTSADKIRFGSAAIPDGVEKFIGDIAQFYLNTDEFLDMTVEANRRKFIDASGCSVSLGADGSDPTGSAPTFFFDNPVNSWHENLGSGDDFSVLSGTLSAAEGSPC